MSAQVPGAESSFLRATSRSNEFASSEAAASRWKKNARSDRKDRRRSSATSAKERRSLVPRYRLWRSDKLTHFCSDKLIHPASSIQTHMQVVGPRALRPMNPARNRLRSMGDRLTTIAVLDEVVGHFW